MDKLLSTNAADILAVKTAIDYIKKEITEIKKDIAKLKISTENSVKGNQIKSGSGTKISYNKYGLVESSSALEPNDIPEIPVSKITSLQEIINSIYDSIKKNEKAIALIDSKKMTTLVEKRSKLTVQEIPDLPISKIKKLNEKLELLEKPKEEPKKEKIKILEEDIPQIFKNRIQNLEETVHTKADKDSVSKVKSTIENIKISTDEISNEISKIKKAEKPEIKITEEMIPKITLEKVNGLDKILSKKADSIDIISINQLLDLTNKNTSQSLKIIKTQMESKVSQEQFAYLKNTMDRIEILLEKVLEQHPVM